MTPNEQPIDRKSSISNVEPAESTHAPRAESCAQRKFRDSRGRLLPGHPGLKPKGAVGWDKQIAQLARKDPAPAHVQRAGLDVIWYALKEMALRGDDYAMRMLFEMAGFTRPRRRQR